ncbi:type II toxin-antitoxin system RelB/DinJ family antitoxin [Tetragenococcus halophilus]|uniref:type II toxin-antitoxin system RelB/DinJ family antitoxin n=1 Tax=Tetragenococcus halophilus TaxID=51669 RepID=UPI00077CACB0|nr:type II toxin-antitoxin system RelB/DinJ family antitoxin [Tetragenococcus halophilus]MDN6724441.1 type II toxin-antitoxin system RelB/DinJ family antitoxin [Tetragenococcus halophilus]QXN87677.1 type II toxin-antitoxin system RelB/DinJ family antitoxin [Tetragenococcus halophilus]
MSIKDKETVQVKIDKEVTDKVDQILDGLGLTTTAAITMYFKRIAADGKIPFDVSLTEQERERIKNNIVRNGELLPQKGYMTEESIEEWLNDEDEW